MKNQAWINIRWSNATKRWLIIAGADTTKGPWHASAVAETMEPMTPEMAHAAMEYARMALESQYPF